MSFVNQEVLPPLGGWFRPIIGKDPFNKKSMEDSKKAALKAMRVLEEHLWVNTFLVGERLSLADLFAAGLIARGFQYHFDKKWRQENPNVTRWYETVYNQPIYSAVVDKLSFIDEAIKEVPPKKEKEEKPKKEQPAKTAPKPKAKEIDDEEEEEEKPAPKPKHPLEALPKPTLVIDDWKRKYSNEETREVALPWFWGNFKPEEYSLWKLDYKYNDELTQIFMTSNLISKYLHGVILRFPPWLILSQLASSPALMHPASTSSAVPRSTARPMTPSSKGRLWFAAKRLFLPLT